MSTVPVYAPMKTVSSDLSGLMEHANRLRVHSSADLITHYNETSIHDVNSTLTNFLKLDSKFYEHRDTDGRIFKASRSGFRSLNLTFLENQPHSKSEQFYLDKKGTKRAFLFDSGKWAWRNDFDNTPFKNFVESLNLSEITMVRLIYLIPPAVGGVHIDASESSMKRFYETSEGVSLTFNLLAGDTNLCFLLQNKVHQIPSNLSSWHFDPSIPHAVGTVNKLRIQLRIFGKLSNKEYLERMNLDDAIWR